MLKNAMNLFACCLVMGAATAISGWAGEYEVDGKLGQTMVQFDRTELHASASFTVFVRDCGWLIETTETNELGAVYKRAVGSTNGSEIYECEILLQAARPLNQVRTNGVKPHSSLLQRQGSTQTRTTGKVISNNIPVGQLDNAVVGHLWLMFASQCYWPSLKTNWLTPVYDCRLRSQLTVRSELWKRNGTFWAVRGRCPGK